MECSRSCVRAGNDAAMSSKMLQHVLEFATTTDNSAMQIVRDGDGCNHDRS